MDIVEKAQCKKYKNYHELTFWDKTTFDWLIYFFALVCILSMFFWLNGIFVFCI